MMKFLKLIGKIVRNLLIAFVWTFVFVVIVNNLLVFTWSFNLFSSNSWKTIYYFWQGGGIIKTLKDYIFLLCLFSIPFLWVWGLRRLIRVNYISILISPITVYNNHIIKKYGRNSSRILLKNLKSDHHDVEVIKEEIESIKPDNPQEVQIIRSEIQKKIGSAINKD